MIHVAIVEDDPKDCGVLQEMLRRYSEDTGELFKIKCFKNAVLFLKQYKKEFDIVFMDVEMPEVDGLMASKRLREVDPYVCLIFVTNMVQHAYAGYGVDAFDFVGKPLTYGSFLLKLRRALNNIRILQDAPVLLKNKEGIVKISRRDILYVEVQGHHVTYHVGKRTYEVYTTLKSVMETLSGPAFALCSNSYYVHLAAVIKIEKDEITLLDGTILTMSRSKKKEFKQKLNQFMGGNSVA